MLLHEERSRVGLCPWRLAIIIPPDLCTLGFPPCQAMGEVLLHSHTGPCQTIAWPNPSIGHLLTSHTPRLAQGSIGPPPAGLAGEGGDEEGVADGG